MQKGSAPCKVVKHLFPSQCITVLHQRTKRGIHAIDCVSALDVKGRIGMHQEIITNQRHGRQLSHPVEMLLMQSCQVFAIAAVLLPLGQKITAQPCRTSAKTISCKHHHFVITEQRPYTTPNSGGLVLQTHHQIEHSDTVGTTIHKVAYKPQRGTTCPHYEVL